MTQQHGRREHTTSDLGQTRWTFDAIGVPWTVETDEPIDEPTRRQVLELIAGFDATWSRFRADSLVSRTARADRGGRFETPVQHTDLLDLYDRLRRVTGGALDPLVGRQLEHLGYDASFSLTRWDAEGRRGCCRFRDGGGRRSRRPRARSPRRR